MTEPAERPELFHPAVAGWFAGAFPGGATPAQRDAWPAIKRGNHCLIAAPTGSGKTLAAFLAAIDDLVRDDSGPGLPDETRVLYISPLRALSNDIHRNLELPLCGIADALNASGLPTHGIRAQVRTGDTSPAERGRMRREPPHILVTTPESLFILLTSDSGRRMLSTVRTVIVDEIHALAGNKRGSHLTLSLERLEALLPRRPVRIGLSATQRPIDLVAQYLVGDREQPCDVIDSGHVRARDLAIELPDSPLEAVMATEVWAGIYDRLAQLTAEHRTTLIFVNTRRLAERAARHLAERIGEDNVTSHHGSLAREHRLDAEQRLKRGELKALVATASLELGIDIGDVDLVCQLGSPRSISTLLQRVGRSGHQVRGTPRGRLFPLSRDDLVECAALLDAVRRNELDTLHVPPGHLDVLAQQLIAEAACTEWKEDALFRLVTRAWSYRDLSRERFDAVMTMLAEGFSTRRGRRSRYIHRDQVNGMVRGRPGARLTAVTNAGAIPDQFDYEVILEPQDYAVGTVNEDFAFESLPGDIFQLGNTSYRVRKVEQGKLRVEDARGLPPNMPFWLGEAPGRSDELSAAVSRLRETVGAKLDHGIPAAVDWLHRDVGLPGPAAGQLAEYLAAARAALGRLPTLTDVVFERFFDEAGDQHLVIHSPFGSRVNRAWGLALRKRFCRKFNFELQAAALEDSIVISLGATHSFPLDEVTRYLHSSTVRDVVTQAMLAVPMFTTHWRWNASIALAIRRNRQGRRVPAQFQRTDAEDLMAVVFPDQLACQDNLTGEREVPDHPLVRQTVDDCLGDVMDVAGLERVLAQVESGAVRVHACDLAAPSPLAQEILTARPYAFLDDAPAEERRTLAVNTRRYLDPAEAAQLGRLDPAAIDRVRGEAMPEARNADELHDALMLSGVMEALPGAAPLLAQLEQDRRATELDTGRRTLWVCAERLAQALAVFTAARLRAPLAAAGNAARRDWDRDSALVELLRARLECCGPVPEAALAQLFECAPAELQAALAVLEREGYCMRGDFSGSGAVEWCERALLARIHRYTLNTLRREIQPVSAARYMRFLMAWHGLGRERGRGDEAVLAVINRLEGYPIPAAAWESEVLPARIQDFTPDALDRLCGSGRLTWTRLRGDRPRPSTYGGVTRRALLRNTPIALVERRRAACWRRLAGAGGGQEPEVSATAQRVLGVLRDYGASFFVDIVQASGLLRTQVEDALAELAANGCITADSFAGLRALIAPASRRGGFVRRRRRYGTTVDFDAAGRWSLVPATSPVQPAGGWIRTDPESLDTAVQALLRRYGVVFRGILDRESLMPPWRELLYQLRRMEARGEVRGGRFVEGFSGEQFALPDAVGLLRRDPAPGDNDLVVVSAADPVNLAGIVLPGDRIPATCGHRIVYRNGLPVACQSGRDIRFLEQMNNEHAWMVRNLLARSGFPAGYLDTPPRSV